MKKQNGCHLLEKIEQLEPSSIKKEIYGWKDKKDQY
jgi:hypothetical protein